uniref:Uncharacterized protein n=1 Tax=Nelumbo nucifera TaxID=4432 RepID=A0A822Z6X3_NELNU|nr:TPA_asm: hypothetical protein HUJ06_013734 [Nelumbo nucifera]
MHQEVEITNISKGDKVIYSPLGLVPHNLCSGYPWESASPGRPWSPSKSYMPNFFLGIYIYPSPSP